MVAKKQKAASESVDARRATESRRGKGTAKLWFAAVVAFVAACVGAIGHVWGQAAVPASEATADDTVVEPAPRVVSLSPRVFVFDNLLSDTECEFLKDRVTTRLKPAGVVLETEDKYKVSTQWRNNEQVWFSREEEDSIPMLQRMVKRMHRVARIPIKMAEGLQVGRYMPGMKYESHVDTDPDHDVARPMTLLMYLSDVESGGDTVFGARNKSKCAAHMHKTQGGEEKWGCQNCCDMNFGGMVRVSPKKGRAVLFFNHDLKGRKDLLSEHAACPVKKGVKWIAQRWFRYVPYNHNSPPKDPMFDGLPKVANSGSGPWNGHIRVLRDMSPRIYLLDNFLTADECRHLVDLAKKRGFDQEKGGISHIRLPEETASADPILADVTKRMHRAAYMPESYADELQIGRFSIGSFMELHSDSAPDGDRPVTMTIYLNDADGGEVVFPHRGCKSIEDCCKSKAGSIVPPKAGRAVLHYSVTQQEKFEGPRAKYGSCPVKSGEQFIIQRFFRNAPSLTYRHAADPLHDTIAVDDVIEV